MSDNKPENNAGNNAENNASSTRKKRRSAKRLIIPIYILFVILLVFIVYAYPTISGAFTRTMAVEYGDLKISNQVTCYIVKNETLYFANGEGGIDYVFDEGSLVRGGSEILTISPGSVEEDADLGVFREHASEFAAGGTLLDVDSKLLGSVLGGLRSQYAAAEDEALQKELSAAISRLEAVEALDGKEASSEDGSASLSGLGVIPENYVISKPGIVSYQLDGYESELNPYTMTLLDRSKVEKLTAESKDVSRKNTRYGEPLFKVVDNTAWYAVMWIEEGDLGKYSEGSSVTLRLPDGDADGTIYKVSENDGEIMVIMKFNTYYDSIADLRKVQTEVVTSDFSGLMIENSFIGSEDGTPGVYVLGVTGESTFVPVKIKVTDGEYSLVESGYYYEYDESTGASEKISTVEVYDEIEKP